MPLSATGLPLEFNSGRHSRQNDIGNFKTSTILPPSIPSILWIDSPTYFPFILLSLVVVISSCFIIKFKKNYKYYNICLQTIKCKIFALEEFTTGKNYLKEDYLYRLHLIFVLFPLLLRSLFLFFSVIHSETVGI